MRGVQWLNQSVTLVTMTQDARLLWTTNQLRGTEAWGVREERTQDDEQTVYSQVYHTQIHKNHKNGAGINQWVTSDVFELERCLGLVFQ